jgi:hypothetical protein
MIRAWIFLTAVLTVAPVGTAAASPARIVETVPELITVITSDDSSSSYARVEPWPGGFVRAIRGNGDVRFLSDLDLRAIRGPGQDDVTDQVVVGRKAIGAGPVPVREAPRPKGPPRLRGRPSPFQKGFTLIQVGLLGRVDDAPREAPNTVLVLDVGRMRNLSPRHSVGGSVFLATDDEYARLGFRPRYRRWLTRTIGIDLAPGLFWSLDGNEFRSSHSPLGFVGEVSLSLGDWIALTGQMEVVGTERRYYAPYGSQYPIEGAPETVPIGPLIGSSSGTEVSWLLGARIGGEAAIPALFLSLLGIAAMSGISSDY